MAYLPIQKRGLRMEEGVQNTLKGGLLRQISEKWVIQQDIQASLGAHGLTAYLIFQAKRMRSGAPTWSISIAYCTSTVNKFGSDVLG